MCKAVITEMVLLLLPAGETIGTQAVNMKAITEKICLLTLPETGAVQHHPTEATAIPLDLQAKVRLSM